MRLTTIFIGLLFLVPAFVKAQFGYGKSSDIQALQSRKLIVIIEEPRDKVLKKLEKKGQSDNVAAYKAAVDQYNAKFKKVVEKFWAFSKNGIEYKTFAETDALRKDKNKDYAVLWCNSGKVSDFTAGFNESDGLDWTWDATDDSKDRDYWDGFTEMKVALIEDLKDKPIMYEVLPDNYPTEMSLCIGIKGLEDYMAYRLDKKNESQGLVMSASGIKDQVKVNQPMLKTKTLLLREDFLDKSLTKDAIAQIYPYKFQIVSKNYLDSAVFNPSSDYVYAVILPAVNSGFSGNDVFYYQVIIPTDNTKIFAMSKPNIAAHMMLGFAGHGKKYIEEKNFKDFTGN